MITKVQAAIINDKVSTMIFGQEPDKVSIFILACVKRCMYCLMLFHLKIDVFSKSRTGKNTRKSRSYVAAMQKGWKMRTGLHKRDKITEIYFNEASPKVEIRTYNTDLKKRLTSYAKKFPDLCELTDEDEETGCKSFAIVKRRFSVRLTAPYNEKRRQAASEVAKGLCGEAAHSGIITRQFSAWVENQKEAEY